MAIQLQMSAEGDELHEIAQALQDRVLAWPLPEHGKTTRITDDSITEDNAFEPLEGRIGLRVDVNKAAQLKEPLNFLYGLAKEFECEFVVAVYDQDDQQWHDTCYFGHEEGRPDMYEIAMYCGLE